MTTKDQMSDEKFHKLTQNVAKIEDLSTRLIAAFQHKQRINPNLGGPGQDLYASAANAYMAAWMQDPAKLLENQIQFWGKSLTHFVETQHMLMQGKLEPTENKGRPDRRFSNPLWETHPYFNYIKRQYQLNADMIMTAVSEIEDLPDKDRQRLQYFAQQIVDMMAPTNFFGTNPDALERAVATEGQSLIDGLENLVSDVEANNGEVLVRLADEAAFELGGNIATAPGKVVFRNRMMELLQFSPTTEKVRETPIVLFPPWINKFYILDLKEKSSLIRWLVGQGYTLFIVSWVNPDSSYRDVSMEDYVRDGYLEAIEQVKAITQQKRINAVGYCIAGTTLHVTLGLLKKLKDNSIKSATFFTTLADFEDQGEFTPFLQDDFVNAIEKEAEDHGILRAFIMARTFSFLRSNDLIYGPAIKSYMMGETPPAFDLLYWNGDGSNLPAAMVIEYLRELCQRNALVKDGFEIMGHKITVKDVTIPVCSVACEGDHIAAWKSVYTGFQQVKSRSKTFIVSESGHVAGIVNPPSKKKYGHYMNPDLKLDQDEWMKTADYHEGSWWPTWEAWLRKYSGKLIEAREPGGPDHPPLGDAPGSYVQAKAPASDQ